MLHFYEYWGTFYNEIEGCEEQISGVVFEDNYTKAVERIRAYYEAPDEECICSLTIRGTDMEEVYETPIDQEGY